MTKVKCINDKDMERSLRVGETYTLVKETKNYYVIKLKYGTNGNYTKDRFEKIEK
ncbi:hypothetical protein [Clostridium sp. YIM B02500]|uniref:hypothetical protein n=1 Tax=Clostridium sp. YIM B02500 TaxID=2910681 RepID=UPI001EED6F73|nr:hypothetical protein [Clostridium sp. YIM B02500]